MSQQREALITTLPHIILSKPTSSHRCAARCIADRRDAGSASSARGAPASTTTPASRTATRLQSSTASSRCATCQVAEQRWARCSQTPQVSFAKGMSARLRLRHALACWLGSTVGSHEEEHTALLPTM